MIRLLFITIWIAFTFCAYGQRYHSDYGVKLGINYGKVLELEELLNFGPNNQYKSRPGLTLGAYWMNDYVRLLGMDIGLEADMIGISATSPNTRLDYFYGSLPVTFRFNIPDDFFISAGIKPSILVGATARDINGAIPTNDAKAYFSPINDYDIQWTAGLGWQNTENFLFTFNFTKSLLPISLYHNLRHQYVQFGIRYFIKDRVERILKE